MKVWITLLFAFCLGRTATAEDLRTILAPESLGGLPPTVIRATATGFWPPIVDDLDRVGRAFRRFLLVSLKCAGKENLADLRHVLENFPFSRRQYVGVIVGGGRWIRVNALPRPLDPARDHRSDWKERYITVDDGGPSCWHGDFRCLDATFEGFETNGLA